MTKGLCATPCTAPGVGLTGGEGMKKRQTHRHTEKLGLECVSVNVCGVSVVCVCASEYMCVVCQCVFL